MNILKYVFGRDEGIIGEVFQPYPKKLQPSAPKRHEAVQAAIKKFEQKGKAAYWDLVADGYDVLERVSKPPPHRTHTPARP